MNIHPVRTAVGCPWHNGVAERWVGSCRRELLDQVIPLNERHLKRLLLQYVMYYHDDRTHLASQKQTPGRRKPCVGSGPIVSDPRIGGLHPRYSQPGTHLCRSHLIRLHHSVTILARHTCHFWFETALACR